MKASLSLLLSFLMNVYAYAQTVNTKNVADPELPLQESTKASLKDTPASDWWRVISKENIVFKTHNLQLSSIEREIIDVESRECGAVKSRDTLTLMRLWARDFTLDKKPNEVIYSKHAFPNYLSLTRMIESFAAIDSNTVFTSGYEMFQEIEDDWKVAQPARRKYSHTWTKRNGIWKLVLKRSD